MPLTGLQIFKLLPNKNCGECCVPTCLAFAMKLVAKSVEPILCPYITEEALEILGASQSPPIKKMSFKLKDETIDIGAETVMYRHEKTFLHQPLIALELGDNLSDTEFLQQINAPCSFERIGEKLSPECISLVNLSGDTLNFLNKYRMIQNSDKIIILTKINAEILKQILQLEGNHSNLIINSITANTLSEMKEIIRGKEIKLVLSADKLEELFELVKECENYGLKNLILKINPEPISEFLRKSVFLRRLALKKNFKPAGYPLLIECDDGLLSAVAGICKYASIVILKKYNPSMLFPLLTLRQNIYTDPQKPMQVQAGIYNIGEPDPSSPLMVTTNFSLTYFIVSGEIENSSCSARLLITDSEGMSVLTAWSANKFSPEIIAKALKDSNIEAEINHRKIIIPGYVSVIKGELEEQLKEWEVMVGPQEASDIGVYLKEAWAQS